MTDFDAATAWHGTRAAAAALLVFAGLGLGGCGTGNLLGNDQIATETAPPPAAQPPAPQHVAKVALAPIIGPSDTLGQQIRSQLTQAAEKSRIGILQDRDTAADYAMRGYLVAARDKGAVKVSYIWDITDTSGKRVNRIAGEEMTPLVPNAADAWGSVTPAVTQTIADKVASSLGTWAPTQPKPAAVAAAPAVAAAGVGAGTSPPAGASGPVAANSATNATSNATTASLPPPPQAAVPGGGQGLVVAGAPGDGNTALADSLRRELAKQGATNIGQPGSPHRVDGKVTLGPVKDGKQQIQIDWRVIDAQGKAVGTVTQKNLIPPGSLDGSWGKTADAAAAAAAQGIIKLLPQRSAAAAGTN